MALGIDADGVKHSLGVEEGSTENAAVVTGLTTGLRDRGLDTSKPTLAVLDGAKALSKAVKDVFDKPVIHRCQQHKIRKRNRLPAGGLGAEAPQGRPGRHKAGHAYVVVDGTLIPIDRLAADRPFYSGKHNKHGMNLQVIASPAGDILWVSGPLPGSVHDKKAE